MITRKSIRILLVEQTSADSMLLKQAVADLKGFACRLTQAESLAEGIARGQEEFFDVVLLDLVLPDATGLTTFTQWQMELPEAPVVVLTALEDVALGLEAIKGGAQDYLVKQQITPGLLERSLRYAVERNRVNIDLRQSREQLRLLTARLIAIREAERTHISREIHDVLGQMLTGLKMDLHLAQSKLAQVCGDRGAQPSARIAEAMKTADRAIETIQQLATELRPSVLDHLGLPEALRDEARRFEARTGVTFQLSLPRSLPKLDEETSTAFFRIFQELLTNVARHADARNVQVRLDQTEEGLVLHLKDDGKGLPAGAFARRNSLGLLGMSERAAALGGNILFESALGKGTSAVVTIPHRRSPELVLPHA